MWYYGEEEEEDGPKRKITPSIPPKHTPMEEEVKLAELNFSDLVPPDQASITSHSITPRSRGGSFDDDPLFDMDLDGEKPKPLVKVPATPTTSSSHTSKHAKFSSLDMSRMKKEKQFILELLMKYSCADLVPESGKTVVFDTELSVISALSALDENHIKSAPLWDAKQQDFVGMMTATDIIEILLASYRMGSLGNTFSLLKKHRIKSWRGFSNFCNSIF
jgi:hypothetical protein